MPESTRRQIGKYRIQAELGRGGFGVVYQAYDPIVGRPVAIKVLTAVGDNQLLTRFKNEAAAAGKLRHKNIVTIYDYGDDDGLPYIVMELLEGEDLNQVIGSQRPMPLLQKVSIMVQVADALHSAHRAGVVHRDVKPANIRLLPDGTVKLMDFGIARLVAGSAATRLTRHGHVIGTLYYMAPEQVLGEDVGALSDIFAYGSTYYELLTGRHPFPGSDLRSVFHKITAEDPEPIRNLVPDCPEALEKIVNRTLQKDRDLRYQSLRDVQLDTEPILIELRQERAESLVAEAKRLYGAGDLENAQTVLGEVFDLDPANREARRLRETIQNQLLSRLIRPKMEALVKRAEDALVSRRYEDAIESFEAALRLDRSNQEVSKRLQQARHQLTLSREIARLIADARRHLSKQNLDGALDLLLQALEQDQANPEAQHLLGDVRAAITRREREREYQDKLQQAKELLQGTSFDASARLLEDLDPEFRDREEVRTLAAQIRSSKEGFERQQQLNREMAAVRQLLASAQYEAAIKRVELLMSSFPQEVEPTRLFILAHRELAASRKVQALGKLDAEVKRQLDGGHFASALNIVSQSLKTYPSEPHLLDTQRRIEAEWARHKREVAIRQLLEESERYSAQNELEKGIQVLEAAVQQYADDPRLTQSLVAKRREEALVKLLKQAEAQLSGREYQPALDTIDRGLAEYGSDERLTGFREKIATAKADWERAEAIRQIVENSRQLVLQNDFERAFELLQSALRQFPEESQLAKSLAWAQETLTAKLREEALVNLLSQAQAQLRERKYQPALDAIEHGVTEYGADRRLIGLREQVASEKAGWERAEAVRQAVEDAQRFVSRQEFNPAITRLEAALKRFPGEPRLTETLNSARNSLAVKQRDEAIEMLCGQAQAQTDNRDFTRALKTIDEALAQYGTDKRLAAMREKVLSAQAEWKRAETIRQALEGAQRHLARGEPEVGLSLLDSALAQYENESKLLQARGVAQEALAAKHRDQAIEAVRKQGQAKLQECAYQDALDLLDRGLAEFGREPRLADLRAAVESAKIEWERAVAIRRIVDESRELLERRETEAAVALLQSALNQYPGDPQIPQAMDLARAELAAKQRNEAIEAASTQAQQQLEGGEYQNALDLVGQAVARYGSDRRLTATRDKIVSAKAKWECAEAIRQLTEDAQNSVAQQDFNRAISLLEAAMKRYPGEPKLAEALTAAQAALATKRRDEAIERVCQQAQTQTDKRDFARALKTVDQGTAKYGREVRLSAMREKILATQAEWERQESVRLIIADSQKRLAQGKPEVAAQSLEAALRRYPADAQLTEALSIARDALESLRREEATESLLRQAQRNFQSHEFEAALNALDRGLNEHGPDRRLLELREKVLSAKAEWERAEALRHVVNEARSQIAEGQPERSLELLEAARSQFSGEAYFEEALSAARKAIATTQREQVIETACGSAQRLLNEHEYGRALQILDEASRTAGKDSRLSGLRDRVLETQAEWERSQAIRQVLEDARKRVSEDDLKGALELLDRALTRHPGATELVMALAETHQALQAEQKQAAIAALAKETQLFIETQDFATALAMVEQGLKAYGPETRLADLRETVLAARADWQRMEMLRQAVDEANALIARGEPEKASRLLEQELSRSPGDELLLDALVKARDAVDLKRRDESIQRLCTESRAQLDRRKFDAALQQIEGALKENPDDRRLLELRESALIAKAEAQRISDEIKALVQSAQGLADRGQHEEATALLERALNEHPANAELVSAIVARIEAVGAAGTIAIDRICRNAREYMLTGDFELAFRTIEQALRLQNEEQQTATQAVPQKPRTEAARAAGVGSAQHRETGPPASVKEETGDNALLNGLREPTNEASITDEPLGPPALVFNRSIGNDIVGPQLLVPPTRRSGPMKWRIIGLVAVLLLIVSAIVIRMAWIPRLAVLNVRSVPPGATIRINDQKCSAPTCEFHLKPGQYQIQVSADGYREVTQTTTLRKRGPEPTMVIALEPLSPTARITANFADGDVVLDNRRAGRLQDGQFVLERLIPGRHNLQVSSREGRAAVSFDVDYAKLPTFTNVSQQNTGVIASANFGNRTVITCSGCVGAVTMDGRQIGELKNGTISIDNVAAGTHQVKVGAERSIVFSASQAPGVNLAINSNRNYGALIIETGEDNAAVFVDGVKYPRLTSRGQLLIPAEAKAHSIRVAKDGYRPEPPEIRVQLARGDQFQARFKLTREPGRLMVSRQLPGAAVLIDGSPAGTVGSDGAFSAEVPPGNHEIEFRKDGYTPARIQRSFEPGRRVTVDGADAPLVSQAITPPPPPEMPAPSSKFDPTAVEQTDWQRITGTQSTAQLEDFLKNHPAGIHHQEAQARLKELQQQEAATAREEAWAAVDKNSKASLQQFLSKYGEGSHAQDARSAMAAIERQEQSNLTAAQPAKEQASRNVEDSTAILNTLSELQAAFNRKDLAALQNIWPAMPKITAKNYRAQFRDARSLEFRLTPAGQVTINENSATVICTRSQVFVAKNGERPPPSNDRVRVTLDRAGSRWVIQAISSLEK